MFWKLLTVLNWRLATPGKDPKFRVLRKTQLHFAQKSTIRTLEQASPTSHLNFPPRKTFFGSIEQDIM